MADKIKYKYYKVEGAEGERAIRQYKEISHTNELTYETTVDIQAETHTEEILLDQKANLEGQLTAIQSQLDEVNTKLDNFDNEFNKAEVE